LAPLRPADRFEPNDAPDAARDLPPGAHADLTCTLDDYYRVALKKGQRLTVTLDLDPAKGDLDLELSRPDGRGVVGAYGVGPREEVTLLADADGRYLVRVYGGAAPYRLDVQVTD